MPSILSFCLTDGSKEGDLTAFLKNEDIETVLEQEKVQKNLLLQQHINKAKEGSCTRGINPYAAEISKLY